MYKADKIEERTDSCSTPMFSLNKEEMKLFYTYYVFLSIKQLEKNNKILESKSALSKIKGKNSIIQQREELSYIKGL